jgi:hypothetical protein
VAPTTLHRALKPWSWVSTSSLGTRDQRLAGNQVCPYTGLPDIDYPMHEQNHGGHPLLRGEG